MSIDAGILTLGDDNALNGNAVTFTAGTSGKLQINGHTVSISGLTTNSGSPGSAIVENGNATADAALTVNVSTPNTFAGVVQNGGTGKLALTVGGASSLALSGHNTFTGGTTINATATLQVSGGQALDDTSAVTDNGTLDLAQSETIGSLTGSGIVTDFGVTTLTLSNGGNFGGIIQDGSGTLALTLTGGTLILSNPLNSYSGDTTISSGTTLQLGALGLIPDGANKGNVILDGTLDLNRYDETINGLTGAGSVTNTHGSSTSTLSVGGNDVTSTFDGTIIDGLGTTAVTKIGTGTLALSATSVNTYTGPTNVDAGRLLVNGSTAAGSAVTVNSGGTLGGSGTVGGSVTVNTGGSITGADLGTIGTLTVGSLSFNGGTYAADVSGNSSDTIKVLSTGAINLQNTAQGVFTLNSSGTPSDSTVFTLIQNDSASAIANPPLSGAAEGSSVRSAQTAYYTYSGGDGNDFTLTVQGAVSVISQRQSHAQACHRRQQRQCRTARGHDGRRFTAL